jgi:hypothetical protein
LRNAIQFHFVTRLLACNGKGHTASAVRGDFGIRWTMMKEAQIQECGEEEFIETVLAEHSA